MSNSFNYPTIAIAKYIIKLNNKIVKQYPDITSDSESPTDAYMLEMDNILRLQLSLTQIDAMYRCYIDRLKRIYATRNMDIANHLPILV